jgi:hypothetical protein
MIFFRRAFLASDVSRGIDAGNLTTKEPRQEENFATLRPSLFRNDSRASFHTASNKRAPGHLCGRDAASEAGIDVFKPGGALSSGRVVSHSTFV